MITLCVRPLGTTKGCHFDNLAPEVHMGKTKASPNQTAVAKDRPDLFRQGIGGNIKVFGFSPQQQITHPTTHQMGLITGAAQTVEYLECIGGNIGSGNIVLIPGNDNWGNDN